MVLPEEAQSSQLFPDFLANVKQEKQAYARELKPQQGELNC